MIKGEGKARVLTEKGLKAFCHFKLNCIEWNCSNCESRKDRASYSDDEPRLNRRDVGDRIIGEPELAKKANVNISETRPDKRP